ncbi:MAG TPA: Sir2 family NAD+-dependent deacetylase [Geminicoccus sp.]|jgi:NAD-dependent deacetylase|uniref:Sir2 family NAD+-dependent deacetylase n=1 Tax=Geminicoccus sp. TaxID=2024832 RepID=UPI002E3610CD|nr:Sir2 family NAD+-dependent deacetylase [Geminicoccus sp.]HEX2528276.1 Sir2 family NAD+-dependent deacetylase [Geminicoccus sp.]
MDARIVILTGAGISAESGLPTFRGAGGLWEGRRFEEVATPEAFARDPAQVHRFYNYRRRQLQDAAIAPNSAHLALAELERRWPGEVLVVTQNVDNLHERAGQQRLIHMHGQLDAVRCLHCAWQGEWQGDLEVDDVCPHCRRTAGLRPDIVWFGEMPLALDKIEDALDACDLFIAIGTSGHVYPAAGFVEAVRADGLAHTVEINLEESLVGSRFEERRYGRATIEVPRFVEELLSTYV